MTIERPEVFPDFATDDLNNPGPNVVEPSLELKTSGWLDGQKPPREYFNWLHRLTNNWLKYLDNRAVYGEMGVIEMSVQYSASSQTVSASFYKRSNTVYIHLSTSVFLANDRSQDDLVLVINNVSTVAPKIAPLMGAGTFEISGGMVHEVSTGIHYGLSVAVFRNQSTNTLSFTLKKCGVANPTVFTRTEEFRILNGSTFSYPLHGMD